VDAYVVPQDPEEEVLPYGFGSGGSDDLGSVILVAEWGSQSVATWEKLDGGSACLQVLRRLSSKGVSLGTGLVAARASDGTPGISLEGSVFILAFQFGVPIPCTAFGKVGSSEGRNEGVPGFLNNSSLRRKGV
jgi:hypothetical protein